MTPPTDRDNPPFEFDDTSADLEADALEDTIADVEVDEQLDQIDEPTVSATPLRHRVEDDPLGDYDPEAGKSAIAKKTTISGQLTSDAGMFVFGSLAALVGIAAIIMAAVMQTRPYIIAASIIAPPAFIWFVLRWKRWVGQVPYLVRLLHTMDEHEDAQILLDKHREKQQTRLDAKLKKIEAKQDRIIAKHRGQARDSDDDPIDLL